MNNTEIFLKRLMEHTKSSGVRSYPVDIVELGAEVGLNEIESQKQASILVKKGIAEYKALGNSMLQIK